MFCGEMILCPLILYSEDGQIFSIQQVGKFSILDDKNIFVQEIELPPQPQPSSLLKQKGQNGQSHENLLAATEA
jgi:hypothetical protein